jgi:hypothetical protein
MVGIINPYILGSNRWIAITLGGEIAFSSNGISFTKTPTSFTSTATSANTIFWHPTLLKWVAYTAATGLITIDQTGAVSALNNPTNFVGSIGSLGYDSVNNRIMVGGLNAGGAPAIWYSTNNGTSWSNNKDIGGNFGESVRNIQHNGGTRWTCNDDTDAYTSTDGGDNWTRVVDNSGALSNPAKNLYAGNASAYIFASSTSGRIWTSTNGTSYSEITPNNGLNNWGADSAFLATAYDASNGRYLIASNAEANSGVRTLGYSTTPATANSWVFSNSPSASATFYRCAAGGRGVFIVGGSLNSGDLPRLTGSADGGATWATLTNPFTNSAGNRVAAIGFRE